MVYLFREIVLSSQFIEKCSELGMPVSIHAGELKWMYEKMDSTFIACHLANCTEMGYLP